MKTNAVILALAFSALISALQSNPALADEKTVNGMLSVSKNDDGKITAVAVRTEDGKKYSISLDDNGKKLAADLAGKKVTVTGDVKEKDDVLWITVSEFKKAED